MRLWTFLFIPTLVCLLAAACGTAPAQVKPFASDSGVGSDDVTVAPPGMLGDGGSGACVPKTCAELGYNCGENSDGCGNMINCGSCTSPQFCGAGGFSQCGGNAVAADAGGNLCVPTTCAALGFTCGQNSDGCGNILDCGTCTAPAFCGGGGYSQCGGNSIVADGGSLCVPTTCAALGFTCGPAGDGCGNMLDCGACTSPAYCGGGGFDTCGGNMTVADGGSLCVPKTCASLGFQCGAAGDGCGNMLSCGTCTAPTFCGGGGFNMCGGNGPIAEGGAVCTPKTCAQQGFNCGPADDGCGHLLQCGTCQLPQICGGGGAPSVCGDNIPCTGLCQNQVACNAGVTTTFTGTVVAGTQAPYGNPDPVPNVVVYIPNGAVQPFTEGVQCNQCGADVTGSPLVETTTDYLGNFTLTNVPVPPSGSVPLVIQLGRWRRQLTFPVTACHSSALGNIHMPRSQSEGDIPFTAISTGNVDAMECVLLKMGVDETEFTPPGGGGRIEMYVGNGADDGPGTGVETDLVPDVTNGTGVLDQYDQVLFPCWGEDPRTDSDNDKTTKQQNNVIKYTSSGGRMFATHLSYSWLYNDAPFSSTATWVDDIEPASATATIQQTPAAVDTFYKWMNALAANGSVNGQFNVLLPRYDFSAITAADSTLWVQASNPQGPYDGSGTAPSSFPLLYTFNTPVGNANQCGRVVYSDFHVTVVNGDNESNSGLTFPAECTSTPMSPQEKALEYAIWDLASCVPPPPTPACTPTTCAAQHLNCGPAGDGCGNQLSCGTCVAPQTCGGGGVFGQCGDLDGGHCTPQTCAQQNIACGPAGDGCGNAIDCGPCVAPQTCGGGGVNGQCGYVDGGSCTPQTCAQQNIGCGPAGDGCGNPIDCGPCVAPQTCGGGGQPGQCGYVDGGSCTPETCQQLGQGCGPAGDGCGNVIQCGMCVAPQTCGGGGTPGQCGYVDGGSCTPQTCAELGVMCGASGDGCGNLINCGSCVAPETCGGGGVPGVCGGGTR